MPKSSATTSSTFCCCAATGADPVAFRLKHLPDPRAIAVIGEVTRKAVEKREFRVDIVPETYTLKGMVDAAAAFFARHPTAGPR